MPKDILVSLLALQSSPNMDVHVIHAVREPLAVFKSQYGLGWHGGVRVTNSSAEVVSLTALVGNVCKAISSVRDILAGPLQLIPSHVLYHEHMHHHPQRTLDAVVQFLKLSRVYSSSELKQLAPRVLNTEYAKFYVNGMTERQSQVQRAIRHFDLVERVREHPWCVQVYKDHRYTVTDGRNYTRSG